MWLKSLTDEQREALLGLAHNVVVSDGILDPNEEDMLDEFKREMALKPDVVLDYLELDGIGEIFDSRRARTVAVLNLPALVLRRWCVRNRGGVSAEGGREGLRHYGRRLRVDGQLGPPPRWLGVGSARPDGAVRRPNRARRVRA